MPHGNCGGNDQGRPDVEMIRAGQSVSAVNGQCESRAITATLSGSSQASWPRMLRPLSPDADNWTSLKCSKL